jgi:hypothetical protein
VNLRHQAQKAYRTTDLYRLERLLAEQSRWKRKLTIATNKLAEVRERIDALAEQLAKDKAGIKEEQNEAK